MSHCVCYRAQIDCGKINHIDRTLCTLKQFTNKVEQGSSLCDDRKIAPRHISKQASFYTGKKGSIHNSFLLAFS